MIKGVTATINGITQMIKGMPPLIKRITQLIKRMPATINGITQMIKGMPQLIKRITLKIKRMTAVINWVTPIIKAVTHYLLMILECINQTKTYLPGAQANVVVILMPDGIVHLKNTCFGLKQNPCTKTIRCIVVSQAGVAGAKIIRSILKPTIITK